MFNVGDKVRRKAEFLTFSGWKGGRTVFTIKEVRTHGYPPDNPGIVLEGLPPQESSWDANKFELVEKAMTVDFSKVIKHIPAQAARTELVSGKLNENFTIDVCKDKSVGLSVRGGSYLSMRAKNFREAALIFMAVADAMDAGGYK